ncbi:hypothetical protein MXD62_26145 [Frankia sp. Mgl5]|uniref:hypothetical protein n=1 Tax=Frankia sp. Mgl5 TaxID=2933793 RepID=UPI00200F25B0|nr:hypothetical protein [Frankia sp. Mgl5]MCK9930604.1 hypothetical protein [Frankia sp. Mgl5]
MVYAHLPMAIRDKLASRARPYLEPGEQVRQVFMTQTSSPFLFVLMPASYYMVGRRIVVVTDRSVVVLRARRLLPSRPTGGELLARLPRRTRFGEMEGLFWGRTSATGEQLWIGSPFHKDVAQADRERHRPPRNAPPDS